MKVEIKIDDAWKILRKHRVKVLASSQKSIEEVDEILRVTEDMVKGVVKSMPYLKIKVESSYRVEWVKGYELIRNDIKKAYMDEEKERLYIIKDNWIMVFAL